MSRLGGLMRWETAVTALLVVVFAGGAGFSPDFASDDNLSFALDEGHFADQGQRLWSFVGLVVALSIVIHGATTSPLMNRLDLLRQKKAVAVSGDEGLAPNTPV